DYVGKGLSGGRIVIYPQKGATFVPQDNVIVGNVVLYGATGGQAFFRGRAAERFAIRNSGASAVIEGLGDHGCEYMTGGRVVVLGPIGRNFAAGMSGGIAYVLADDRSAFAINCNQELVELESITGNRESDDLRSLLEEHVRWTGSEVAAALIDNWEASLSRFVRVIPRDYKRVLAEQQSEDLAAPSAA
ncbi:MAG: glutamate synthase subunit alpha, partial [Pseudomonadota bacterium]|nr:glutamate synthase subunit alpha [Pseudomonadota bacterium]